MLDETLSREHAVVSFDVGSDTLRIAFSDPERVDFGEIAEDLWVFFNAERFGDLAGIEATGVSFNHREGWLETLITLVGDELWQSVRALLDEGVTVRERPLKFPYYDHAGLSTAWKAYHFQLQNCGLAMAGSDARFGE